MKKKYLQYIVDYSLPLVFSNLCLHLFASSDKLMLQRMNSNKDVGIYSLAFTFASALSSIWYALNHAWCPLYYKYESEKDKENLIRHLNNFIRLFSILTIGFILLSPEVFRGFSAPKFGAGEKIIPIFALAFYLDFMSGHARLYQYYHKKTKSLSGISLLVAVANLLFNSLLIPIWGILGAALATLFAYITEFIASWLIVKVLSSKGEIFSCKLSMFIPYFIVILVCVFLFYLPGTVFLRWISGVIAGIWLMLKIIVNKEIL